MLAQKDLDFNIDTECRLNNNYRDYVASLDNNTRRSPFNGEVQSLTTLSETRPPSATRKCP